jgi:hypothetical protein
VPGATARIEYSNWRGPVWFPMNFLLIRAIAAFAQYYDDSFTIECPTGSGRWLSLTEVASELARRLTRIFLRDDASGRRAVFGENQHFQHDPHWRDYVPFFEFFHGETGTGLGASHQTGWTALVALLLQYGGDVYFSRLRSCDFAQVAPGRHRHRSPETRATRDERGSDSARLGRRELEVTQ